MKYALAFAMIVLLAGCGDKVAPRFIVEKPVVFVPDDKFFVCPTVTEFPDPTTLTDAEVAELLVTLDTYNTICAQSLEAVRQQLLAAKQKLETTE